MPRYFTFEETKDLDADLVEMLDRARGIAGFPFIITEGLATGGSHVPNTAHGRGRAVDLRCSKSKERMLMVKALLNVGIRRIGIYDKHVHADNDESLPQDVLWLGESK